jgi:hypothetical protein
MFREWTTVGVLQRCPPEFAWNVVGIKSVNRFHLGIVKYPFIVFGERPGKIEAVIDYTNVRTTIKLKSGVTYLEYRLFCPAEGHSRFAKHL